jgi:hypothetical protein
VRPLLLIALLIAAVPIAPARAQETVAICHATGNPQNPYQPLTLDNAGVLEHINHEDDLVPAPAEGCPAAAVVDPVDTPTATATPQYALPTPTATAAPTATPRPHRDDEDDQAGDDDGSGNVKGAGGSGGSPTLTSAPPGGRPAAAAGQNGLPMTGAEIWLIAAAGLGFLLCGSGIRLLSFD